MYNNMLFKTNPSNTFTWFSSHCSIFPEEMVRACRECERESFGKTREQEKWGNNIMAVYSISPQMPQGPCFNQVWSDILLKNVTPRQAENRIKKECEEWYTILPGFIFRDVQVLLKRPMIIGIDEKADRILLPFTKPCFGTSLYCISSDGDEISRLRRDLARNETTTAVKRKK